MKIGLLLPGHPPDDVRPRLGDYGDMYERLLAGHGFTFARWEVVEGVFPQGPDAAEGWLVGGSRHGVYEDHAWIPRLEALIRDIHASGKPLVGICFGHQIIAQALGGRVGKHPGGWALGHTVYDFTGTRLALNAWHQDQVTEPPEGAEIVASTPFCAIAALRLGNVFTVQPHPEFGAEMMQALYDYRAGPAGIPADRVAAARTRLDRPTDSQAMADRIAAFFRQGAC